MSLVVATVNSSCARCNLPAAPLRPLFLCRTPPPRCFVHLPPLPRAPALLAAKIPAIDIILLFAAAEGDLPKARGVKNHAEASSRNSALALLALMA